MIDARTAPFAALILRLTLSFLFSAHLYRKYVFTGYLVQRLGSGWLSGLDPVLHGCCGICRRLAFATRRLYEVCCALYLAGDHCRGAAMGDATRVLVFRRGCGIPADMDHDVDRAGAARRRSIRAEDSGFAVGAQRAASCLAGVLSRGLSDCSGHPFLPSAGCLTGVSPGRCPIHGMATPAWAALSDQIPKPAGSRPVLSVRGLDGDGAYQATICVAMGWLRSALDRASSQITFQYLSFTGLPPRRIGVFGTRSIHSLLPKLLRVFGLPEL